MGVNYVINIDRMPQRLEWMRSEFSRLGMEFVRVSGVDGSALAPEDIAKFSTLRPIVNPQRRQWIAAEIGCFLSHFAAWKAIAAADDDMASVFEDDLHLSPRLRRFVTDFEWVPADADVVRLVTAVSGIGMGKPVAVYDGISVRKVFTSAWDAGAYILRRDVANWLTNTPARYQTTVDQFLFHKTRSPMGRALSVYQLDPAPCVQDSMLPTPRFDARSISTMDPFNEDLVRFGRFRWKRKNRLYLLVRPVARALYRRQTVPFADAEKR